MKTIAISNSDLDRSVCAALKAANAKSNDGVERCFDILRYLKSLNLSVKELRRSKSINTLGSLRDHGDPKVRVGVDALFNSWMKTLYCSGRDPPPSSTCNKSVPLPLKKPARVLRGCSELKKKKKKKEHQKIESLGLKKNQDEISDVKRVDHRKSFAAARPLPTQTQIRVPVRVSENPKPCPSLKSVRDNTCKSMTVRAFSRLNKTEDQRSLTHETGGIKQNLNKSDDGCKAMKQSREMLELFEIAKKSADVANAKGILLAKAEASVCVDTLRRIMEKLGHLTKHKDRRICNSASALLQHWRQSIREQQRHDSNAKVRK